MDESHDDKIVRPGLFTNVRKDIPEIKRKLRARLPQLTQNDLRRAKTSFENVLIVELLEDGFVWSSKFIRKLLEYDVENSIKLLKNPDTNLNKLIVILKSYEESIQTNQNDSVAYLLLFKGCLKLMATLPSQLIWIVKHLFLLAFKKLKLWNPSDKIFEARYLYEFGGYYHDRLKDFPRATNLLVRAFQLCKFNTQWKVSETNYRSLRSEVVRGCVKSLKHTAIQLSETNIEMALEYASNCVKFINENMGEDYNYEIADCYRVYGELLFKNKDYEDALRTFQTQLTYAHWSADSEQICHGHYNLIAVNLQ